MKIIVIGAGHGGLQAAKVLAEGGATVTVFEQNKRENLCYDWLDDVETKVFSDLDIPLPKGYFRTANVTFTVPDSKKLLDVIVPDEKRDWSIERRPFINILVERAEKAGATIYFDTPVESLYNRGGYVAGIIVGGHAVEADLVIDSSGATSPFRAKLPACYKITPKPQKCEIFKVYRAFYNHAPDVKLPTEHTKKIYLKHLGEDGISWCVIEPNGDCNLLVGRIGEMSEDTLNKAMEALRADNPIIGDKMLRGGDKQYVIPVRYALSRMTGKGYAAIGDAAFMTIPMIGSGIANSLRAGQILAETILKHNDCDVKTLWEYQYRYFKEIGAANVSVDGIKRMLLSQDGKDIKFLFESGIISEVELNGIASGEKLVMGPKQIFDKVKKGITHLGLLINLAATIGKGEKAEKHAYSIPETYDEKAIDKWAKKLDVFFNE